MESNPFGLRLSDFSAFGAFAAAGLEATTAALTRVERSYHQARVPIAGAAVHMDENGALTVLAVGNNGRIPPPPGECADPDPHCKGYPTDHGETGTIRQIEGVGSVDWSRVVFTTSLNPCIMCNRTLTHLWTLGLNKIVVADVSTYEGTADMLKKLPGMILVELNNAVDAGWMTTFARTYPWDWNADIGQIPPANLSLVEELPENTALQEKLLSEVAAAALGKASFAAGVVTPDQKLVSTSPDDRAAHDDNPTFSAPMIAMGRAGSSVNLHECAVVFVARDPKVPLDIPGFGHSSRGACELFRPGTLLTNVALADDLRAAMKAAGVPVIECLK